MSKVSLSIKTKLWHILKKKCSSFFNSNFDFGRREISRSNLLFFHSSLLCCLKQHCLTFRVNIVSNLSRSENVLNNINPGLNSKNNVITIEIVSRFRRLGCSKPPPPKTFICNRPFYYMIRERSSGLVIFSGRVVDPSQ